MGTISPFVSGPIVSCPTASSRNIVWKRVGPPTKSSESGRVGGSMPKFQVRCVPVSGRSAPVPVACSETAPSRSSTTRQPSDSASAASSWAGLAYTQSTSGRDRLGRPETSKSGSPIASSSIWARSCGACSVSASSFPFFWRTLYRPLICPYRQRQRRSRIDRLTIIPASLRRTLALSSTQSSNSSARSPNEMTIGPTSAGRPNCGAISTSAALGVIPCDRVNDQERTWSTPGKERRPVGGILSTQYRVHSTQSFMREI